MKKLQLSVLIVLLAIVSVQGQGWSSSNGKLFTESPVIIGDSADNEISQLTLISSYHDSGGGGYGLLSKHATYHDYLKFNSRSRVGYSSLWYTQAQCAAFHGRLYLKTDNSSDYDSHSAGGSFVLEFDDYGPFSSSNNIHFLGGTYSKIMGAISEYPFKSAISAVIGHDEIQSDQTFGGYFIGRGYFSDNLGVGTESPKAKIQVADGDIYISDINQGIIMKSPDGKCWKGILNNNGSLNFTVIECPDYVTISVGPEKSDLSAIIYPNPCDNVISVTFNDQPNGQIIFSIISMDGKVVKKGRMKSNDLQIDISSLLAGTYLINFTDKKKNKICSRKIIKN